MLKKGASAMSWKELHVMDQRKEFVLRAMAGESSLVELCREYGIARKTGYKWKERFLEEGLAGLHDQSRRPASSPQELSELVVCRMIRLRQAHPSWGARKLQALYQRNHGVEGLPSESSFKRVLDRAGLVEHRPRRASSTAVRLQSRKVARASNELWTVDFKGWWYTPDQQRCEPLTVRDAFSRYILCAALPGDARSQTIRGAFERLFERYGLPETIRSDNGRPFAVSSAPLGLSRLSAWWVALGIDLDRTDPGHPEQNGSHERMHKDLAAEVQGRIAGDLAAHAAALELWRQGYNQERPHEALGMKTPAEVYVSSVRRFTGTPEQLTYGPGYLERQVNRILGTIKLEGRQIRISTALSGWNVGLKPHGQGIYTAYFGRLCLGKVDVANECLERHVPEPLGSSGSATTVG
jgi:transposase InsO family protein